MKKFVSRVLICAALVGAVLAVFCAVVYDLTGGKWARPSYQKGFVYQVRALERGEENGRETRAGGEGKVLLMGGSYLPFGVNMPLLRKLLNAPAYSLGIHAAMGESYVFETARRFVNAGDTVVYIFEPVRRGDYGMPLIYQTMDGESDMMLDFFLHHPVLFACTFPEECAHRVHEILLWKLNLGKWRPFEWEGIYHERAFDRQTGDMTYPRECKYVKGREKVRYKYLPGEIPEETVEIINAFGTFCRNRNAQFVIAFPPCVDETILPGKEGLEATLSTYEDSLRQRVNVPIIAHVVDQIFPYTMMYDKPRHLNDRGAAEYTRRLARDILAFQKREEEIKRQNPASDK